MNHLLYLQKYIFAVNITKNNYNGKYTTDWLGTQWWEKIEIINAKKLRITKNL